MLLNILKEYAVSFKQYSNSVLEVFTEIFKYLWFFFKLF